MTIIPENNNEMPKYFFKYRSLQGKCLDRTIDILKKNRLYLPKREQLNDLIEGCRMVEVENNHSMGDGINMALKWHCKGPSNALDSYHVLSLSDNPFSQQMWAYYADSAQGICIAFRAIKELSILQRIQYVEDFSFDSITDNEHSDIPLNHMYEYAKEALMKKHIEWQHEREWRFLTQENEDYFPLSSDSIFGIILGANISESNRDRILQIAEDKHFRVYYLWAAPVLGSYLVLNKFPTFDGAELDVYDGFDVFLS